jgi:hypothetical protein
MSDVALVTTPPTEACDEAAPAIGCVIVVGEVDAVWITALPVEVIDVVCTSSRRVCTTVGLLETMIGAGASWRTITCGAGCVT